MKKYYWGIEDRSSMTGQLISSMHLLVERSTVENTNAIFERMLIISKYGNFEAEMEFRFENESMFHVINIAEGKEIGQGTCVGAFDTPISMVDTISIQQTKEKAIAVFSFDGPRIFVGKTYFSLESGKQTGFAVEKCLEISEARYSQLKAHPQSIAGEWQKIRFD